MRVLTVGTWDCLHLGHINLLNICRKLAGDIDDGGIVMVGVNTDKFVESYKNKTIQDFETRCEVLKQLRMVNGVLTNLQTDKDCSMHDFLISQNPDILVVGSDYLDKNYYQQIEVSQEELDDMGITLVYIPYTKNISTSDLKKRICNQK